MSYKTEHQARKESFQRIDETCPNVESAFEKSFDYICETLENFRSQLGEDITDALINQFQESLNQAETSIKNSVTYKFREELIKSCNEKLIADETNEEIENELKDIKSDKLSLEDKVENLEEKVDNLESKNAELELKIESLNDYIWKLEESSTEDNYFNKAA